MKEIFQIFSENLSESAPQILWAVLVFLFGFFISKWLGKLTSVFLNKIRLNQAFQRMGWEEALARIDSRFLASKFFGGIVRCFCTIIFLWAACRILAIERFSQFLEKVIFYFPNIFIAAFIFVVAVFLADFSQKIIIGTLEKEKITYSNFLGRLIRWLIWFFAALAILYQLKVVPTLILIIFVGMVLAIAIAAGVALGLGGKDLAKKFLEELEDKFK